MQKEENGQQSTQHTYLINGTVVEVTRHYMGDREIGRLITEIAVRQATEAVMLQSKVAEHTSPPVSK